MTTGADHPDTWHHGLVAQWWAEFNHSGPEIDYFRGLVERHGQPALDVACGTGRLLLPMLDAGLDVDGTDVSADMLEWCAAKCATAGVAPALHAQAMDDLELSRRYRTIFVCGGFGLGGDVRRDRQALVRMWQHLQPGGALAFDVYPPYAQSSWKYWEAAGQLMLPEPVPEFGEPRATSDGSDLAIAGRLLALDPITQVATRELRVRRLRGGLIEAEERYTLRERFYFRDEVLLMLTEAGFVDASVEAGYTGGAAGSDAEVLVFIAHRPT